MKYKTLGVVPVSLLKTLYNTSDTSEKPHVSDICEKLK